jgi:hypothetical protein
MPVRVPASLPMTFPSGPRRVATTARPPADTISFTPTVSVTTESTSDPQTGVTFAAAPTELAFGTSVSITGAAQPGASVAFERYDQPTSAWVDAGIGLATTGAGGS